VKVKIRTLYIKKGKQVSRCSLSTNRRFLARIRDRSGDSFRVVITYTDDKKEYDGIPNNDTGWCTDKESLVKTTKAFLYG